jgi:hypothetical protein
MKCKISLHGCDGSTYIKIELTEEEHNLLKRISDLSKQESSYPCMPILEIETLINPAENAF